MRAYVLEEPQSECLANARSHYQVKADICVKGTHMLNYRKEVLDDLTLSDRSHPNFYTPKLNPNPNLNLSLICSFLSLS